MTIDVLFFSFFIPPMTRYVLIMSYVKVEVIHVNWEGGKK